MRKEININKPFLIAGIVILAICLCIILPIEYRTASFLSDLKFTFFSLTLALLTLMYSLMGKHFFKGLLFLLLSIICGIACWFLLFPLPEIAEPTSKTWELFVFFISAFAKMSSIVMGTVTGIIAGLIFLAVNFWFLADENRYKLFAKRLLVYLPILLLVAFVCHEGGDWIYNATEYFKDKKQGVENQSSKKSSGYLDNNGEAIPELYLNAQNVVIDTVDGKKYTAFFHNNENFYIINSKNDTVFKAINQLGPDFKFVDFDNDGNKDIIFNYTTNIPGINDLILYDEKSKSFKRVNNFSDYPDSKQILNTKYYYSYHRSGCADESWDSDLFYIENFKTHKLANISVDCGTDTIKINRPTKGRWNTYKILPETKTLKGIDKWIFIEKYWKNNYLSFT